MKHFPDCLTTHLWRSALAVAWIGCSIVCAQSAEGQSAETLPPIQADRAPADFDAMWSGFDPRAEPLEVETIQEWEEEGVVLRIVRFRIGVFKQQTARLAAVYGFPKADSSEVKKHPGLVQIHGGGQYADHKACLMNAKRGYATVSISWAGRISAPNYRVTPDVVKLFWDGKTDDPAYRLTTDWGAVDGYHAPGRNPGNVFPSAKPESWTIDPIESPRNSGWFLCAVAARRALTFLEQQPEVDPERLGVYGHSMGGKLTVMTASDPRVKAAAPSCGGISDRDNKSERFQAALGDQVSLARISCPIIFLSPANDFHGRIGDLPRAIKEIQSDQWRVTCAPHHNHQDTAEYEVATLLWFDQHLKGHFQWPQTPKAELDPETVDGVPTFVVRPDTAMPIRSVDVYYTQQGKPIELSSERENTMHRFWRHVAPTQRDGVWTAKLPLTSVDDPLWVYANVQYEMGEPVSGAGYYYGLYTTRSFNLSSLLQTASPDELRSAGSQVTVQPSLEIEDFRGDWQKEWFTYKPDHWARTTHKLYDSAYRPPSDAMLSLQVRSAEANELVILVDEHAAIVPVVAGDEWQMIVLSPDDFRDADGNSLSVWDGVKRMSLDSAGRLRSKKERGKSHLVGGNWRGDAPEFRDLRWQPNLHP